MDSSHPQASQIGYVRPGDPLFKRQQIIPKLRRNPKVTAINGAIEVDLTTPKADRESIYAALRTVELWVFDGKVLTISRLGQDGRYHRVERRGFLPLRGEQVLHWLERAHDQRVVWLFETGDYDLAPAFDGLRSDPRFRDLLQRFRLPA